jgi:hypothetical protein
MNNPKKHIDEIGAQNTKAITQNQEDMRNISQH